MIKVLVVSSLLLFSAIWLVAFSANPNAWTIPDSKWIIFNNDLDCVKAQQVSVSGGMLNLTISHTSQLCSGGTNYGPSTQTFMSGALYMTSASFPATNAHVDVRAKFTGTGTHPTVWAMGTGGQALIPAGPYSTVGASNKWDNGLWCATDNEIDFGEGKPGGHSNTTTLEQNWCIGPNQTFTVNTTTVTDYSANFHVYSMDLSAGTLRFCVDGAQTLTHANALTNANMYIILSDEMDASQGTGGTYPATMQVDYVRIAPSTGTCTTLTAPQATTFDEEFASTYGGSALQ